LDELTKIEDKIKLLDHRIESVQNVSLKAKKEIYETFFKYQTDEIIKLNQIKDLKETFTATTTDTHFWM